MSSQNESASAAREEYRQLSARIAELEQQAARLNRFAGVAMDGSGLQRAPQSNSEPQIADGAGLLARGVVHDFGTLLSCILAEADLALATLAKEAPERERIDRMRNLAIRAGGISQELMDSPDREGLQWKPVDVSRLAAETLQLLTSSIPARAVVETVLPDNLPCVNGNFTQLQRVVMNLIANAAEALGENDGVISLRVSEITQYGGGERQGVRIEVRDTGCGMAEEAQARIFDSGYSTKAPGRGLGLASAWEIVRAHGGEIQVTSAPGEGSRFEVLLPATASVSFAPEDVEQPRISEGVAVGTTVLLIEDDELLRHVVARLFREKGFSVLAAADGRSALDLFRARRTEIGAVFLDVTLPEMSGREVLEQLRGIQPDVKVILTTAHSEDAALAALGGQQPWRFIRKPYRLLELIDLIQDARLASRRTGAQA